MGAGPAAGLTAGADRRSGRRARAHPDRGGGGGAGRWVDPGSVAGAAVPAGPRRALRPGWCTAGIGHPPSPAHHVPARPGWSTAELGLHLPRCRGRVAQRGRDRLDTRRRSRRAVWIRRPGVRRPRARRRRPIWLMSAARYVAPSVAPSAFAGFRFPPEVITLAVRWYLRFGLSYRDVEEFLAERGIEVDHVSIFRWVQRFTPLLVEAARLCRHRVGDRWGTRLTSRCPVGGATSTGRSISSGRSLTCMCPSGEMLVRRGVSSPRRWPPRKSSRWRSPPTR